MQRLRKTEWPFLHILNVICQFLIGRYTQKDQKQGLKEYLYVHVHSSMSHKSPKVEANQVSISGQADKVCTKEYDSALKRMRSLTQATTATTLEDIMLRETKQLQKHEVNDPTYMSNS